MNIKYLRLVILIFLIAFSTVYLSGCMMAGMGIMHGRGSHDMNSGNLNEGKSIIKEFQNDKYVITAEFPSIARNSSDICKIKVFNKNSNSLVSDVDAYLYELVNYTDEQNERHGNNPAYKISASRTEDGYLIFRHNLSNIQSYNLIFRIKRIENNAYEPPIEIQTKINDQIELNNNLSHHGDSNTSTSTYFYIGAAAMAVMMYFIVR